MGGLVCFRTSAAGAGVLAHLQGWGPHTEAHARAKCRARPAPPPGLGAGASSWGCQLSVAADSHPPPQHPAPGEAWLTCPAPGPGSPHVELCLQGPGLAGPHVCHHRPLLSPAGVVVCVGRTWGSCCQSPREDPRVGKQRGQALGWNGGTPGGSLGRGREEGVCGRGWGARRGSRNCRSGFVNPEAGLWLIPVPDVLQRLPVWGDRGTRAAL